MNEKNVEVSIVLPCLNEENAIGICLQKIKEVFDRENISGEIIVADNNSIDRSREIAEATGARVVIEYKKGYGAAYLRGLLEAHGKYIVIGDSDNSYDFCDIPKFLKSLRAGNDLVMGSRFKGGIKKGAMSWSHRYIGNPILSYVYRLFFRTWLSDIYCGMRAFTGEAYRKMGLRTLGMEFAIEMVVSAHMNKMKIDEIPINYNLRIGVSKLRPLHDAWSAVRFMLLYCPTWLYFIPGILGFAFGASILSILAKGPFFFLGRYWDMHVLIFGSMISILSYQILNTGIYAHTFAVRQGFLKHDKLTILLEHWFNLERGLILGGSIFLAGFVIMSSIFIEWFSRNFGALYRIRESILAMTLLIIGLQTIFSSFFISLLFVERNNG